MYHLSAPVQIHGHIIRTYASPQDDLEKLIVWEYWGEINIENHLILSSGDFSAVLRPRDKQRCACRHQLSRKLCLLSKLHYFRFTQGTIMDHDIVELSVIKIVGRRP
jgi:hypothetical protein